jgi:hypothetical protein
VALAVGQLSPLLRHFHLSPALNAIEAALQTSMATMPLNVKSLLMRFSDENGFHKSLLMF